MKDQKLKKEFLTLVNQHISIIHKITRLYEDTEEDRRDLFKRSCSTCGKGIRVSGRMQNLAPGYTGWH